VPGPHPSRVSNTRSRQNRECYLLRPDGPLGHIEGHVHDLHPHLTTPRPSCWLRRCCPLEPSLHPQGRPREREPQCLKQLSRHEQTTSAS
jgi:hypothetical protein